MFKNQREKDSFVYVVGLTMVLIGVLISLVSLFRLSVGLLVYTEESNLLVYLVVYAAFGIVILNSGASLCRLVQDPEDFFKDKTKHSFSLLVDHGESKKLSEGFLVMSTIFLFVVPDYIVIIGDFTFMIMVLAVLSFIFSSVVISRYKKIVGSIVEVTKT